MSDHDEPQSIHEVEELRRVARDAGLPGFITPESLGVELDSPDEFLAKMKRLEPPIPLIRRRSFPVAVIALGAVAATTALALGVIPLLPNSKAEAKTPPILSFEFASAKSIAYAPGKDAAAELKLLSKVAANAPAPPGHGTSQYVVTDNWFESIEAGKNSITTVLIPQLYESTLRADGSYQLIERRGNPLSPEGRGLPKHGEWDSLPKHAGESLPADSNDADFVKNLPSDIPGIRAALLKDAGCHSSGVDTISTNCLFNRINALYSLYVMPPKLSSHLWAMLSTESGVRLLGSVEDRAGRNGVGISLIPKDEPETRYILIISPATGQLLGSENILIKTTAKSDVKAPAISTFTAILDSRYTKG